MGGGTYSTAVLIIVAAVVVVVRHGRYDCVLCIRCSNIELIKTEKKNPQHQGSKTLFIYQEKPSLGKNVFPLPTLIATP